MSGRLGKAQERPLRWESAAVVPYLCETHMTEKDSFDLELRVLYFVAKSVMPRIDDCSACGEDGRILGTVFYGGLGTIVADAFERREEVERIVPTLCAIVEYAAVGLERSFELWAPRSEEQPSELQS